MKISNKNKTIHPQNREEILGPWRMAWNRFKKKKTAMVGGFILILLVLSAIFAPYISPHDPNQINARIRNQPPSSSHWLGTDHLGRDYFSRILYGGRISLMVGLFSVTISVTLGTLVGGVAGYFGGKVDDLLMRFAELVTSFPFLPLAITLTAVMGSRIPPDKRIFMVMMIIGILSWPGISRMIRGQILSLKEQEYILAARALGIPSHKIIIKHLLPNVIGFIIVAACLGMAGAILAESGLSFIGMGVTPPTSTWGNLIQYARDSFILRNRPWLWIPPGVCIFLAVMSINLLGDGLRDALDPKSTN